MKHIKEYLKFVDDSVNEAKDNLYLQLHKKYAEQIKGLKAKKIKKLTDLVSVQRMSMEDREDYFDMDPKKKKELSAEYNEERKLLKKYMARDYSVMLPKGTESLKESLMSELDILAKEAKNFKVFTMEVFKEFKNLPRKADTLKWLEELYNDAINEAEKAKGDRSKLSADIEKALKDKATESGVPIGLLRLVMRRGLDAWNSSHRAGIPQVAWGYARVNAFLEKGKGTWGKADADIAKEVRDEGKAGKLPIKNPSEFTKKEREA